MAQHTKLRITPVIEQAQRLSGRVQQELPTHDGLRQLATAFVRVATEAEHVAAAMRRPFSVHRLPVIFLTLALVGFSGWVYWQFFHVSSLTLALPDRDAAAVKDRLMNGRRLSISPVEVPGSREAAQAVASGAVDLAFIQGGVSLPPGLLRLETPNPEVVLLLLREGIDTVANAKTVLTSSQGEGSHSVALDLFRAWRLAAPTFSHRWRELPTNLAVLDGIDAVLVVKDLADEKTELGVKAVLRRGFRPVDVRLGGRASSLPYLSPTELPAGHIEAAPASPAISSYRVSTYLVARSGLTPRRLTEAAALLETNTLSIAESSFRVSAGEASELLQGADALLSILVNIGLAFLALLGLDVMAYRKRFHELNSLVSIVSLLQSNKDVLGAKNPVRAEHLLYLSLCSDLLGLISAVTAYYTQENSSLLFNNLSEVIHQRCDALKLNIQLKVLHAGVDA